MRNLLKRKPKTKKKKICPKCDGAKVYRGNVYTKKKTKVGKPSLLGQTPAHRTSLMTCNKCNGEGYV